MRNRYHVGRGTTRGGLTVFPIWAEVAFPVTYSTDHTRAKVQELPGGPRVGSLAGVNTGDVPLLLLEGQLLEGGWQNRMIAQSTLLPPGAEVPLDVVCVEQGRWQGGTGHAAHGQRASVRVGSGLRRQDRQGEVWRRVAQYEEPFGPSDTGSYLDHADRAEARVRGLVRGLRPFPGQVGVLIGLAGQPLAAEIFDTPRALANQFDEIVRAAALDAVGLPPIETPGRRARRFMERADLLTPQPAGPAGIGEAVRARSEYVDLSGLVWNDHPLHTLLTNPRHELVLAA